MIPYGGSRSGAGRRAGAGVRISHTWGCTGFDGGMEAGLAGGGA